MSVDSYDLVVLVVGVAFLVAGVVPHVLRRSVLTAPMALITLGALVAWLWPGAPRVDPVEQGVIVERLAEATVIISLMSVGLKLDRRLGWRRWHSTWRLLAITMPLSIAGLALGGAWLLGIPLAAAVLLGAVLAPTDPVLASDVQVGPAGTEDDEVRFALSSEAGLNDGLAFPFVNLAIVLAATGLAFDGLSAWLAVDVLWKLGAGAAVGVGIGRLLAWVVLRFTNPEHVLDGFVALALTFVTYGIAEVLHSYGFVAVFVAALAFRDAERHAEYHRSLHEFAEQAETLLMSVMLVGLGAAIVHGVLAPLTGAAVVLGVGFVVVIRPLAGIVATSGLGLDRAQRGVVSVFGIRGIGTFYYLAHGLNQGAFDEPTARTLWAIASLVVVLSVVMHGATATRAMQRAQAPNGGES